MTSPRGASGFADHFSGVAAGYARHRPDYPAELFDWIAGRAPARRRAWDAATGSGQAAAALRRRFAEVVASDASPSQLASARRVPGVRYLAATAESSALAAASVDAVTVGQALHWLDGERFAREVERVLRPRGVVVAWTYRPLEAEPGVQQVLDRFYDGVVGACWPPERRHVESAYRELAVPGESLEPPTVAIEKRWDRAALLGYVSTWSAVARYRLSEGRDPIPPLEADLSEVWSDGSAGKIFRWPLAVLAGRIPSGR